ncbi:MAG: DUF448 domain-containing protein [Myxococcota bacterium]
MAQQQGQGGKQEGGSRAERQCAACRRRAPASRLLRFAPGPKHQLAVDVYRRLPGRGAHTCPAPTCIKNAVERGAFSRSLHEPVVCRAEELIPSAAEALAERAEKLLGLSRRQGAVRIGADETERSLTSQRAHLLLVATDAAERTRRHAVDAARHVGVPVVDAPPMAQLGAAVGKTDVAVMTVESLELADEIRWHLEAVRALRATVESPPAARTAQAVETGESGA